MLRTDRTSGHYHLDEMVNYFCHMSSVRGTSDGRGPVTRTRVPDRDEQGKPSEDARRGRCHPLEAGIYPCGCHRYRDTQLPSTKYQVFEGRMSIYVLVVRARSHEYGLHHMYVGGFFTGNRPPVFPPRRFTTPPMYHERGLNSPEG
jgi:hypothetical protein